MSTLFSEEKLLQLNPSNIPSHVAIIPDGNRRWSRKQDRPVQEGHSEGADILMDTLKAAKQLGIKAVTFYVFSTENWVRLPEEVTGLMALIEAYLINEISQMKIEGVRLQTIGDESRLPASLKETIKIVKNETKEHSAIDLILALNYGARDELVRACRKIAGKVASGQLSLEDVTESLLGSNLDTEQWPDPDLLIRTSGESRLSNFMLWQLSYAEVYVTSVLWPDFRPHHLLEAVIDYQKRQRRRGGDL